MSSVHRHGPGLNDSGSSSSLAKSSYKSGSHSGATTAPSETTPLIPATENNAEETRITLEGDSAQRPSSDEHTEANQSLSFSRACLVVFALGALIFVQATNISMLTTIQSAIADDLDAFEKTSWFTSVYLIMTSALGPLNGKLSSVFSPRLSIFVSSVLLAAGSVMTGLANDFNSFVVGRAVTGIGASGVLTVSTIIVLELTGSKRRGLAIGLLNSGYTFGVSVGATVAGALLPVIGWRALFWLQAIPALLGGLALLLAIPMTFNAGNQDGSEKEWSIWQRLKRLDYSGAITLTATLALMLYALSAPKHIPIWTLVLSMMVAVLFVSNEVYVAYDPIIPVNLLKSRGLLLTCLGSVGFMMARWSVLFYAPTYAIAVRQWAPSSAGAILIPTNAGFAAGGLLVGWLHVKRPGSFYFPTLVGYGLFPFTLAVLAVLSKDSSPAWAFILVVFLCGLTTGAALNYNLAHLLHITPKETHYVATALLATFRGFAAFFGAAIGGALFTRMLDASLKTRFAEQGMERPALIRRLLGSPALVEQLDGVERQIAVAGYQDALKLLWLSMALIAVAMLFVQAGTGQTGDAEKRKLEGERQGLLNEAQEE
ncbi:hypothetical protein AC578_1823 [Pseudocercospora eumusae]|uniref:Major facilitator superfamily (MFS) profile domain-containing protein n=1 Tax=Pseudocercospora eumusae TaxID=321146 RepID=A0A139HK98_9PEZI|nr:hypothetical protein AC578_1823 [Pseudocercospora eumusae]